jgi:regulator of protease activity HflC (stomatin/prohibitin superfamily)
VSLVTTIGMFLIAVLFIVLAVYLVFRYFELKERYDEFDFDAYDEVMAARKSDDARIKEHALRIDLPESPDRPKGFRIIAAVLLVLLAIVFMFGSMGLKQVGPGQEGVKTRFGQVQEGTLTPGLHWLMPMVEGLTVFDTRVQAYNFEGIEGATQDLKPLALSGLINFHIEKGSADDILQYVGGPSEYAQKVFLRPANTALKEQTPKWNAFNVISKRDEIGQATLVELSSRMEPLGIVVDRVSVENISLNDLFLQSVEQKQIAQQDLERANFEADRNIRLAEGDRDARITRAEGEAQANDLINESLTADLLTWATIQKLADDIKVMLLPSDQGLILDIGNPLTQE